MLRIFLTGDNHIGLKYAGHAAAAALCAKRIAAFEDMVDCANAESADLFVVAGDLFESNYGIAKKDVAAVFAALSGFRGTVAVMPGNHDYYDPASKLWQCVADVIRGYDNILLLCEFKPYLLTCGDSDVVLYPALCTARHSEGGKNNLDWIKQAGIRQDSAYRIGIAHGAVEGETIDSEGVYFPMTRAELGAVPVDVWLIGHTHVPFPRTLGKTYTEGEKIFNAGTHVQTDVSCNTDGECFVIEIGEDKRVRAKKFVSGNVRFVRKTLELKAGKASETVHEALKDLSDDTAVDLILTGAVTEEEYASRRELLEDALSRFLEGTYDDSALSRLISKQLIDAEFPETSFSAHLLCALLGEPKEAQLAYELLKSLRRGK